MNIFSNLEVKRDEIDLDKVLVPCTHVGIYWRELCVYKNKDNIYITFIVKFRTGIINMSMLNILKIYLGIKKNQ